MNDNPALLTVEQQWEEFYKEVLIFIFPESELKEILKLNFYSGYLSATMTAKNGREQLASPALRIAYWYKCENECLDYIRSAGLKLANS